MLRDDRIFAMKVTIFGAAFDPPHLGHQSIALSLLDQGLADSVWLLPVREHAFGKKLAPENDRLAMVELLANEVRKMLGDRQDSHHARLLAESNLTLSHRRRPELISGPILGSVGNIDFNQKDVERSHEKIRVERWELEQTGISYTDQTLRELSKLYPKPNFSFVIGSDNLARFNEWQNYQQMLKKFPFFVYPRLGFELSPIRKGMILIEDAEPIEVSSTQVRDLVVKGKRIDHLVPKSIKEYILNNKLYH